MPKKISSLRERPLDPEVWQIRNPQALYPIKDYKSLRNLVRDLGDEDFERFTPKAFSKIVQQSYQRYNKVFNNYQSFIATLTKLQFNVSWEATAGILEAYDVALKCPSSWRKQCTTWIQEFVKKNRILNPNERFSKANNKDREERAVFKTMTMLTDAFPCAFKGVNGVWWDPRKRGAKISTTVITDFQGIPISYCTGQTAAGDGKKLTQCFAKSPFLHFQWEMIGADGAYTALPHTLCPWRVLNAATAPQWVKDLKDTDSSAYRRLMREKSLSKHQQNLNEWLKKCRGRVEQFFGRLTGFWRFYRSNTNGEEFLKSAIGLSICLEKWHMCGGMQPMAPEWEGSAPFLYPTKPSEAACECVLENLPQRLNDAAKRRCIEKLARQGVVAHNYINSTTKVFEPIDLEYGEKFAYDE